MKKSYIALALSVVVATASCRRSEQETPDRNTALPKISTSTISFAETTAVQMGDAVPTPQIQYAPGGANSNRQQIGVITPLGTVDTAVISRLTNDQLGRQNAPHSTETFRAGDMIGVFVHSTTDVVQGEDNHTVNTPYIIADGATWAPVYALGGAFTEPEYYMSAYYPYSDAVTDALQIPHSVELDQSAPLAAVSGALEKSNLLIARGAAIANATTNAEVSLTFAHAMSLFEVKIHLPQMVESRELDSLETIIVKGTETRAMINLATGGITVVAGNIADIKPRCTAGNGRPGGVSVFEAIVVPQNMAEGVTLLEIRCRMKDGTLESFDYTIPKLNWMAFKSGYRTSITLVPTAEASFMGELPQLIDGLAHADMALPIFVAKDLQWELSVENIDWMTIADAAGGTYGKTLSGNSPTGAITNIFVKVDANNSQLMPRQGEMILRVYRTDGSEVVPARYLAVQNYYNFADGGSTWNATAASGSTPVAPFSSNQMWRATSGSDWVKLAASAIYGQGNPAATYSHVGALQVGQLFLQADANNSVGARQAIVSFVSDHVGGTSFTDTVKQAAPTVALDRTELSVTKDAVTSSTNLFTVTAPLGVKWKVLSLTPESGKDMGLSLNYATGAEVVGTGVAQQVMGTYGANALSTSRYTNVVIAYAAYGAAQQVTFKITQAAAGPEFIVLNGLKWTKGNLVADGANGCKVGAPGDGGLYFQYGGLVGYKGGANGDGTGITNATTHPDGKWWGGAAAYSANDVAVAPATYATKATWPYFNNVAVGGFGYYYFNTFVTKYMDFQTQANANNPTLGIGDPCAHYIGNGWRLPTVYELSAITGNSTEGSWVPWSTAGVTGKWSNSGPQSTMGAWFGPNSRSGTPTTNTDLFIPASGYRNYNDGAFYWVGIDGYLWSSSVYDYRYGFDLGIRESYGVFPRDWNFRAVAFPVRCVQDIPTEPNPPTPDQIVTINGLKWTKGNLVADGANGCKVGAPGDAGLYFQYGGLIGYKGGATGDGTGITNATTHPNGKWWGGAAAYSANDVAVAPATYATKATWPYSDNVASGGFGYYYFNTFVTKYMDFQTQANALNVLLGIGDPCAHYIGNGWRLPTVYELSAITGNSTEGSWVPWSTAGVTGKWSNSGPQSTMGAWFGPNSRSGTPTTDTDLFIPASGYRSSSNGAFYDVGTNGYLWSSSVYDYYRGFRLVINESSGVVPRSWSNRAHAFPVRCVQDIPTEPNPPTPDQIVTINGLKWTKGNLVANGGANGCKVGAPGDAGLYFQYGGLVGYKGGANGDGTGITNATTHPDGKWWGGAAAYSANDVAVAPATYATKATWPYFNNVASGGFGYYYFNTFVTKYMDFQTQANANNPTLGIGDPCAHYIGNGWRLPKYDELSAITGNSTEGSWVPWSTAGVTGKWSNSGPQSTMGAWFGPNSRTGTPTTDTDLFLPASGCRHPNNGAFYDVGIEGLLWSSSVYDYRLGFYLGIHESNGVVPRNWSSRAYAFPVRCVAN